MLRLLQSFWYFRTTSYQSLSNDANFPDSPEEGPLIRGADDEDEDERAGIVGINVQSGEAQDDSGPRQASP